MKLRIAIGFLSILAACNGTDVGNPPRGELAGFDTPGCKSHQGDKDRAPALRGLALNDARYDGLTCFIWQRRGEDDFRIEVTNYADGCGSDEGWKPSARVRADGGIDLVLDNPTCVSASCGWCLYDLAFDLRDLGTMSQALEVRLLGDACSSPRAEISATLSLDGASSGISCGYANKYAVDDHACKTGTIGRALGPCLACDNDSGQERCNAGLRCIAVEPEHTMCLESCTSDGECEPREVMRCIDGSCRLPSQ